MKAVVQKVSQASVTTEGQLKAQIGKGLLILVGIGQKDQDEDASYLANKIITLRIFEDHEGKLNKSSKEVKGDILAVPNFTLYGDCSKGRRPSFAKAASPEEATYLFNGFVHQLKQSGLRVETGDFGKYMAVKLTNDGPVTLVLES